jgi:hypothetical protein
MKGVRGSCSCALLSGWACWDDQCSVARGGDCFGGLRLARRFTSLDARREVTTPDGASDFADLGHGIWHFDRSKSRQGERGRDKEA